MSQPAGRLLTIFMSLVLATSLGHGSPASAQDTPRHGGELVFEIPAEPPSFDAHREETFAVIHSAAPHYNTLLRVDPFDKTGTKVVGDLAESWTISKDGRTYTFKIRPGVRFHDGSPLTSRDIKATYDKIIFPPAGVVSNRKGTYRAVESVEAPTADTFVLRLKWPEASFLSNLASPWNWIYKADILAKDPHWYETHVMGTGPFKFVEYVRGSHWVGVRNPDYWDKGKPYLDGFRALFIGDPGAQVAAIRGGRAMIQFRGFSPAERDQLVSALGDKITVQESPWDCAIVIAINHQKKPFDDRRVRRALTLALDRYEASRVLSRIAHVKEVAGIQVPGTPWATPPEELAKLAGYWKDINASRAEARRLLKEAGAEGLSFTYTNRGVPMPYEPIGIWALDQWRKTGLNVKQVVLETSAFNQALRTGSYEVGSWASCGFMVEPDLDLHLYQSEGISSMNYSHYKDPVLDDLYLKQSRAADPEERRKYLRAFEKRLHDEEAHYLMTLQWQRIVPYSSKVHGFTVTPSHYLNNQLDTVWLGE